MMSYYITTGGKGVYMNTEPNDQIYDLPIAISKSNEKLMKMPNYDFSKVAGVDVLDEIQKVIDEYIADTGFSATDAMERIIDLVNARKRRY